MRVGVTWDRRRGSLNVLCFGLGCMQGCQECKTGWVTAEEAAAVPVHGRLLTVAEFHAVGCVAPCVCAAALQRIQVHLLTGDNKATAHAIARELAIPSAQVRVCV